MSYQRATLNQIVQLGWENPAGTPVATTKSLEAIDFTLGSKPTTKQFRASGRRYNNTSALLTDMSNVKLKGIACFNALGYLLGNLYGKATPVAHGPSTSAFDSIWTPPIAGAQSPSPWTLQQGDGTTNEQYSYSLLTGFGYEVSRKSEVSLTGDGFAQAVATGATLTSGATVVPAVPMTGGMFNLYLDNTSAGLGTTQLLNPIKFGPNFSGYYGQYWPVNRANASFGSHVDTAPKCEFKLQLEADAQGWSLRSSLTAGTRCYVRVAAVGPVIDSTNSIDYGLTHDLCFHVTSVADLADADGIYAIEWTLELAEDSSWGSGQAQKITLTNALSAY